FCVLSHLIRFAIPQSKNSVIEMANHTVILKKTTILPFLTCKICDELLEDATAIVECLHLFCKKCIHHKIIEEELEHCPVCDLDLGPKPLEKLRHDESMQSIRNTIFPPRKENVVNKADDDVANAEKNELLGDLGIILFEDPENEKDVALKDLLDTSKEHVENIKESLLPSEKSHCMENKNVKGKSICLDNVEEYNTDEILQIEDNNNGSQVEKSRQKKKKHKKKTKNIAEIYQKHETIIISGESTEYLPLALEDFDQVNILRDNSSFWICLEASEKQKGDMPHLPQISEKYIRIEDGSLPVSYIQNYITKKLNLKNDDE
ncbi:hypothetical protein S83_066877, partial [Arachis hypogaea]